MDTSPGSLGDPNRCWHEDLLEADYKHAGIGYHDSMKYLCNSCGVGIHVTFEKLSLVGLCWPGIQSVGGLLNHLGVALSSGQKPYLPVTSDVPKGKWINPDGTV